MQRAASVPKAGHYAVGSSVGDVVEKTQAAMSKALPGYDVYPALVSRAATEDARRGMINSGIYYEKLKSLPELMNTLHMDLKRGFYSVSLYFTAIRDDGGGKKEYKGYVFKLGYDNALQGGGFYSALASSRYVGKFDRPRELQLSVRQRFQIGRGNKTLIRLENVWLAVRTGFKDPIPVEGRTGNADSEKKTGEIRTDSQTENGIKDRIGGTATELYSKLSTDHVPFELRSIIRGFKRAGDSTPAEMRDAAYQLALLISNSLIDFGVAKDAMTGKLPAEVSAFVRELLAHSGKRDMISKEAPKQVLEFTLQTLEHLLANADLVNRISALSGERRDIDIRR